MTLQVVTESDMTFIEGDSSSTSNADVITAIIEACFSSNAGMALLYADQLPREFFDLSSRVAGDALQRLRNYDIRLAVVAPSDGQWSSRFGEMVAEERRGRHFGVFESRSDAVKWLAT